jgi:hypothetical protein
MEQNLGASGDLRCSFLLIVDDIHCSMSVIPCSLAGAFVRDILFSKPMRGSHLPCEQKSTDRLHLLFMSLRPQRSPVNMTSAWTGHQGFYIHASFYTILGAAQNYSFLAS